MFLAAVRRRGAESILHIALTTMMLTACGGGGGGGSDGNQSQTTYTVGGTVTGLNGTVALQNNGGNNLNVSANGDFTFSTALASGSAYAVTVLTQPSSQTCTVASGSGNVGNANVASVSVNCTSNSSNATLSGGYRGLSHGIFNTQSGQAFLSALTADTLNDGNFNSTASSVNFDATILPGPFPTNSGTYSVTSSGVLTTTAANGNPGGTGAVLGGDGDAYVLTNLNANTPPGITVAVKAASGITQASLAGEYTIVCLQIESSSARDVLARATIDATGNTTFSVTENLAGTISTESDSGMVAVSNDGAGLLTLDGDTVGAISANGQVILLHNILAGEQPQGCYGIKQGTGVTTATLSGSYTAVQLTGDSAGGTAGTIGTLISLVFDGKGNLTGTGTENQAGVISSFDVSESYTLQSDGTLAVASGAYRGAVTANGDMFVLANVASGENPEIVIGIRQ